MSRIGLKPITLPQGVEIQVDDKNVVSVKGPKGALSTPVGPEFDIVQENGELTVVRPNETKRIRSLHGLYRSLIANMVVGVTEGYSKKLQIVGTGYRVAKQGNKLVLNLGYSHQIELEDPAGVTTEAPDANTIIVSGCDKQAVGAHAAKIRDQRKPEPYKGKGVKYADEQIRRKVGKTGK